MGKIAYEQGIWDRLQGKPHLKPIFTSVLYIPERLRQYDRDFFICLNFKQQRYEIHSLANLGNTYCLSVPFDGLDSRILDSLRRNDIRTRGKEIFREMDLHNERLMKSKENHARSEMKARILDSKSLISKAAWDIY